MEGNDDAMEFPLGFRVLMFDDEHNPTTELIAGYGKTFSNKLLEAHDSVVVIRNGGEQVMYSDKLFWYQDVRMIYTRSHVRIVTADKEIEADSLIAIEDFSEYTMFSGRATLDVDDED